VNTLTLTAEQAVLIAAAAVGLSILLIILAGKRKEGGYNPRAIDRDGDGIVQEGTKWERPAGTVKIVPKATPKKKAPAKKTSTATTKKPAAKKTPAKKAAPKKK
jgi:hypothetical protein